MEKYECPYGYYGCGQLVLGGQAHNAERDDSKPQTSGTLWLCRPVGEPRLEGTDMVLDRMYFCCQECMNKVPLS